MYFFVNIVFCFVQGRDQKYHCYDFLFSFTMKCFIIEIITAVMFQWYRENDPNIANIISCI